MRILFLIFILLLKIQLPGQDLARYNPVKAEVHGGAEQTEQVLQTQLTLPKNTFMNGYHDNVIAYFLVDSLGKATSTSFHSSIPNNAVYKELKRVLKFYTFKRMDPDPQLPYLMAFNIAASKYGNYIKQEAKGALKPGLPADSSFIIYSRSDRSPEYYKNGDEGLQEHVMAELEYPKVALEKSVEGTVVLEFIVETNGFVTGITVRQPLGANCTEEAIRLIKSTRWQPAQLNGKLVRYRMSYPITFSLRNVNKDSNSGFGQ